MRQADVRNEPKSLSELRTVLHMKQNRIGRDACRPLDDTATLADVIAAFNALVEAIRK